MMLDYLQNIAVLITAALPIAGLVLAIARSVAKRTTNKVDDEVVAAATEVLAEVKGQGSDAGPNNPIDK